MPGVKTIADLKGKTMLTTANAGVNTFFPLVLKNAGLAESDINLTNVPDGALVSSYLQGAGDAVGILGGLDDKPAEIKANGGDEPVTFAYSDFGVNQVGYCIVDPHRHGREQSRSGEALRGATMKAYAETEAIPTLRSPRWPTSSAARWPRTRARRRRSAVLDVTLGMLYSAGQHEKKLGLQCASDWEDMLALDEGVQRPGDRQGRRRISTPTTSCPEP